MKRIEWGGYMEMASGAGGGREPSDVVGLVDVKPSRHGERERENGIARKEAGAERRDGISMW